MNRKLLVLILGGMVLGGCKLASSIKLDSCEASDEDFNQKVAELVNPSLTHIYKRLDALGDLPHETKKVN